MDKYEKFMDYHLKARIYVIETQFGGRKGSLFDDYRGQFFWHINDINCSDWDARYIFEGGEIQPGSSGMCKIMISNNLREASGDNFPAGSQFGIREGSRIVAVGVIEENQLKNASQT